VHAEVRHACCAPLYVGVTWQHSGHALFQVQLPVNFPDADAGSAVGRTVIQTQVCEAD